MLLLPLWVTFAVIASLERYWQAFKRCAREEFFFLFLQTFISWFPVSFWRYKWNLEKPSKDPMLKWTSKYKAIAEIFCFVKCSFLFVFYLPQQFNWFLWLLSWYTEQRFCTESDRLFMGSSSGRKGEYFIFHVLIYSLTLIIFSKVTYFWSLPHAPL